MGNWSVQQEAKKEVKEKERTSRETLGKFFYDLAKLVFTAMALVGGVSLIIDEPQIKHKTRGVARNRNATDIYICFYRL